MYFCSPDREVQTEINNAMNQDNVYMPQYAYGAVYNTIFYTVRTEVCDMDFA